MKLNCDLGESFAAWKMGLDDEVMPHIDMANIACGFHASDPNTLQQTLSLAIQHKVTIGAHPSYHDLIGFGRRSIKHSEQEIINLMHYQIGAIDGMAQSQGALVKYVKPHGALYNDMMANDEVFSAVVKSIDRYYRPLKLMILSTADNERYQHIASKYSVDLLFEAFADRRYTDKGRLTPRTEPGAVLNKQQVIEQVTLLITEGVVISNNDNRLTLKADTLCVHGDNIEAVALVKEIKALCR
ncbi:5-oxoprolinase subunit PxpA [Thalassotalea mangrovi]|uniref:5-oxoprolinase subunit PxpA n=1 Tax=Thalassotalea mangrovi TaxID=2572245 RepID=A0A4U1B350_9GAMM|nr:5-oxoprolinase subunit PxpA [Thalassotalea mangrovi]TKB44085.1 5-oxoprolinase subunit PxpA [Thalassotalea mangrovi]